MFVLANGVFIYTVLVMVIIEHCLIPAVHLFSWNTNSQLKQKLCESRTSTLNTDG